MDSLGVNGTDRGTLVVEECCLGSEVLERDLTQICQILDHLLLKPSPILYFVVNPHYHTLSLIPSLSSFLNLDLKIHHPVTKFLLKTLKKSTSLETRLKHIWFCFRYILQVCTQAKLCRQKQIDILTGRCLKEIEQVRGVVKEEGRFGEMEFSVDHYESLIGVLCGILGRNGVDEEFMKGENVVRRLAKVVLDFTLHNLKGIGVVSLTVLEIVGSLEH